MTALREPAPLSAFIRIKHGYPFGSEYFARDGKYKLLTPGNFNESGGFRNLGIAQKHFTAEPPPEFILEEGDILVAMTEQSPGLLGATLRVPGGAPYLHNQRLGLVELLRPDLIAKEYVYHLFNAPHVRKEVSETASGTKVKHTSPGKLCAIVVALPPIDRQRQIAFSLDDWDAAIEKTERLIVAKEQRFSSLIDRIIVPRGRTDQAFRLTPLHRIADRVQRKPDGNALPLLTISSASGFVRQEDKYSRYMAGESAKTYTLLKRGEFAYNKGNSLRFEFGCVFPLLDYDAALVPSVYVSFRLREGVNPSYLQHVFAADYLKPQLRALVKTGVRNNGLLNIRPDEFMGTAVPLPPLAVQQQIAAVLDEAREEIRLLALELQALRTQKRGLMQKLLTGKWHVPIDEGVTA